VEVFIRQLRLPANRWQQPLDNTKDKQAVNKRKL
jgi:hypothetical protein